MKRILPLIAALVLAACGGGGGGGSSSAPVSGNPTTPTPPPASGTGLSVTFDKSSLDFTYNEGGTAWAQTVIGTATGNTDKDILMGAEVSGTGIATPIQVAVDEVRRKATITVVPQRGLAPGTYTGTIKLLACANQDCSVQHGGSPYTMNYSVTVRAGLKPSASALNLAAAETGTSTVSTIGFTPPAPGANVTANVNYLNGPSGWLKTEIVGSTLQVQAIAGSLSAGSYEADLYLGEASSGQSVRIPVKLTIGSGLTVPPDAALRVTSTSTAADMQGSVMLALAPGARATRWVASSNQPWLKLTRASGDFGTRPEWAIDLAAFDALPNDAHHKAEILVVTDVNLPSRVQTLDVHKALAGIKGLDAVALLAGQGGDLLVYGSGFDHALPFGQGGISVAGVQPTAVAAVSDKVLRVSLPPLQAGSYAVTLKTASGLSTPARRLVVTQGADYGYQALDTEGLKNAIVWDAVSKSAFVVNSTLKSVMRYADVNGRFQLVATRSFPSVDSVAMTPDRTALVLQSGYSTIHKLSPTDLSTVATFPLGGYGGTPSSYAQPLTIMGDNRLMHPLFGWIDLDTGAAAPILYQDDGKYYSGGPAAWGIVSGDGMRMIRPDSGLTSPQGPIYRTDVSSGRFAAYNSSLTPFFYRAAANHDGTVWSLEGTVVDFDLNVRGYARLPDDWLSNQAAMSRDGTRLYHYAQSAAPGVKPRIYVFDTSRVQTTEVNLPVLGYIEFDDLPNCPYDSNHGYYEGCYTFSTSIAISDDGKTLFVVGDRKFVVVPVPANLAGSGTGAGAAMGARRSRSVLSGQVVIPARR